MNCIVLTLVFEAILLTHGETPGRFEARRVTRIINGELIVGWKTGYNAVRYITALGTLHGQAVFDTWLFDVRENFGAVTCGGALITPVIVQTACHCLSYNEEPDPNRRLLPAKVKTEWEALYRVYIGVNKQFGGEGSMAGAVPLLSQRFMIHQSCVKLPKGTVGTASYDFGWVTVDPNWAPGVRYAGRVSYAPLYSESELRTAWELFERHRPVCMVLGFGPVEEGKTLKNKRLRHGWLSLSSSWKCVLKTSQGFSGLKGGLALVSWVCMSPFNKHDDLPDHGDSGSPVTCDNQYFALVSSKSRFKFELTPGSKPQYDPDFNKVVSMNSALYYAKFQNTEESRREFMRYADNFRKYYVPRLRLIEYPSKARSAANNWSSSVVYQQTLPTSSQSKNLCCSFKMTMLLSLINPIFIL